MHSNLHAIFHRMHFAFLNPLRHVFDEGWKHFLPEIRTNKSFKFDGLCHNVHQVFDAVDIDWRLLVLAYHSTANNSSKFAHVTKSRVQRLSTNIIIVNVDAEEAEAHKNQMGSTDATHPSGQNFFNASFVDVVL